MSSPISSPDTIRQQVKIEKTLQNLEHLPVMPEVQFQLLKLLKDENRNAQKMADIISTDGSITGEVLKVANSAYYQRSNRISSLKHAISMMGMVEVEKISMAICSQSMSQCQLHIDLKERLPEFSAHVVMTALLCNHLVKQFKYTMTTPAEAYAIALLHNMGHLALAMNFPEEVLQAINHSYTKKIPSVQAEREIWGMSHADIGAWLMEKWNLPETFSQTLKHHHEEIPRKVLFPEYLVVLQLAIRLTVEFQLDNPFEGLQETSDLPGSTLKQLPKDLASTPEGPIKQLARQHYDEYYQMRTLACTLTSSTVEFAGSDQPTFIVRKPKPLS